MKTTEKSENEPHVHLNEVCSEMFFFSSSPSSFHFFFTVTRDTFDSKFATLDFLHHQQNYQKSWWNREDDALSYLNFASERMNSRMIECVVAHRHRPTVFFFFFFIMFCYILIFWDWKKRIETICRQWFLASKESKVEKKGGIKMWDTIKNDKSATILISSARIRINGPECWAQLAKYEM